MAAVDLPSLTLVMRVSSLTLAIALPTLTLVVTFPSFLHASLDYTLAVALQA